LELAAVAGVIAPVEEITWGGLVETGPVFVAVEAVVAVVLFVLILTAGTFEARRETGLASDIDSFA